jgi:hypothetical protein
MNIVNSEQFSEIEAFEFGYGPVGNPLMSVYVYVLDGIIIDTGQSNMRKHVIEIKSGLINTKSAILKLRFLCL